jgi:SAM-dependent methyltransferase
MWDQRVAAGYDQGTQEMYAPEVLDPAVDFLAALAPGGRALEFAVGTGRIALPLSDRGVTVAGIDTSEAMIDVLRGKPGAGRIDVVVGDMATGTVDGTFDLVYLVFNTISNLLTQSAQVACFRNAARHLRPGGRFVIEVFVPNLRGLPIGALAQAFRIEDDRVGFDTFDLLNQGLVSHHYTITDGRASVFHSHHRFVWPSELDLMGELAGLTLVERWADWARAPFTADSPSHVSVWQKPA